MGEPFQYAVIRIVPRVEREEFVNVGVVVFCRTCQFLGTRVNYDPDRVRLLAPDADLSGVAEYLEAMAQIAAGDPITGPLGALSQSERFGWLTAPSSTVVQTSPVHSGLSQDPAGTLERLFEQLVPAG